MGTHSLDYTTWVDKYTDMLFAIAYYKVGKKEEAEDLVQDTFLAAYKGRHTFNGTASEKTWLSTILKNKIIDYYRKQKVSHNISGYLQETNTSFDEAFFNEGGGRWKEPIGENYFSTAADSYLIGKEFQKFLSICLEKMPLKIRSIFLSKYIDDEKTETICNEYNITANNYWIIIFRAKTILRTCLLKKGVIE